MSPCPDWPETRGRSGQTIADLKGLKQAVAGGLGLAVLSRGTLSLEGGRSALVELDVEGFPVRRHCYAVRPKGKPLSVVAATFLAFLREYVQLLAARP